MITDPFALLDIERRYELDLPVIRRRLITEAARRHPDRAPDPVTAAAWTEELARRHEAAEILLDDLARAESLLALRGGPTPSEDRTLPDGFLESMLAIRMELEEAMASGDETGRSRLETWARDEWAARRRAVAELLDGGAGCEADVLVQVRRELNRWRYAQRMIEQLDPTRADGV